MRFFCYLFYLINFISFRKVEHFFFFAPFLKSFKKLDDPNFRGVIDVPTDVLKFLAIATNGTFLNRIVKQPLYVKSISQVFDKNPMFETFDEKFQQLVVGGLIDHYDKDYLDFISPQRYNHLHPKGPKVLTMKHLQAGFIVCFVPLIFAVLGFIYEWLLNIIDYFIFMFTLKAFYNSKISEFQYQHSLVAKIASETSIVEVIDSFDDELDLNSNDDDLENASILSLESSLRAYDQDCFSESEIQAIIESFED